MFERFTDRARRVVVLAQENARLRNWNQIDELDLFYAIVEEGDGVGSTALKALGMTTEKVSSHIPRSTSELTNGQPFTVDCKRALEMALREALQLGHNYIGTEHLLLALVRQETEAFVKLTDALGLNRSVIRQKVIMLLSGYERISEDPKWEAPKAIPFIVRGKELDGETYLNAIDVKNALLYVEASGMHLAQVIEFINDQFTNPEGN